MRNPVGIRENADRSHRESMIGKRIAIILPSLGMGGSERVAVTLANNWAARGYKPIFILFSPPSKTFFHLDRGSEIVYLVSSRGVSSAFFGKTLGRLGLFRKVIVDREISTVLSFLPQMNVATILATMGLKRRVIVCERNNMVHRRIPPIWRFLRKLLYRHASLVTINAEANRKILLDYVPEAKVIYLPNPVRFQVVDRRSEKSELILSVGRFVEQKGYLNVIEGFALSRARQLGWRLVLAGDGPDRSKLESLINQLGVTSQVELIKPSDGVWEKYSKARFFLLASLYEGTPNALIEALSVGMIPVVSSGVGDIADHVKKRVPQLVFQSGSSQDLTNALDYAIQNVSELQSLERYFLELSSPFKEENAITHWDKAVFGEQVR